MHTYRLKGNSQPAQMSMPELSLEHVRGFPMRLHVGLFDGPAVVTVANLASLSLVVKDSRSSASAPLMAATVTDFTSCTSTAWADGSGKHAEFEFTAAECALDLSGSDRRDLWLSFKAITSDGDEMWYGGGKFVLYESGAEIEGEPPENAAPGISLAEADARYIRGTLSANKLTFPNGQFIYLNAAP